MRPIHLAPLAAFFGLALALGYGLTQDPSKLESALIGKSVPAFELPGLDAAAAGLTSADLATGEPQLLNVFASWCAPCRIEHPQLNTLAEMGVPIHGLNWRDSAENAQAFLDELGNPFQKIGFDDKSRVVIDFGIAGVPETFVIDGAGKIVHRHVGPIMERDLERTILPLLEKLGRPQS
ncbi:MAG: DsbE family thiol:disulfide interchange protein [Pseudomonadota bacterium]